MAKQCFCGCGREVPFGRRRAANAVGRGFDEHLALFRGALERGADPEHAQELAALVARGEPLRDGLRDLVHGAIDRGEYDKPASADWLRDAQAARQRFADEAIETDYAGWNPLEQAQLVNAGRSAPATLVEVVDTGTTVNARPRVRVRLRVEPEGEPPFEVERKLLISRVHIPRAGERVDVFYDPDDRDRFTFRIGDLTDDVPNPVQQPQDVADQLEQLARLHASGALSDDEFADAKRRVLGG